MLTEDDVKKLIKAGEIAKNVRRDAEKLVKPGVKLLEIAERLEERIRELGGKPAFPINISVNEIAAHYTPIINDDSVIPDGSVVKIDIGVHIDGLIADTAVTVSFNPAYESLLEASMKALEKAINIIRPGIRVSRIGKVIEETISSYGFKPIRNLTGHSIDKYMIHSGITIPNCHDMVVDVKLADGIYAIEPFATNGVGLVDETNMVTIYSLKYYKSRGRFTSVEKRIMDTIWRERRTLPFCERWIRNFASSVEGLRSALNQLYRRGMLVMYPVLVEKGNGIVSQFEHTIVIYGKEVIVTTM